MHRKMPEIIYSYVVCTQVVYTSLYTSLHTLCICGLVGLVFTVVLQFYNMYYGCCFKLLHMFISPILSAMYFVLFYIVK